MPNWVLNKVHFDGNEERIKEIKNFLWTEENKFDFEKVIPMPKELSVPASSEEPTAIACYEAWKKGETTCAQLSEYDMKLRSFEDWVKLGEQYLSNLSKYGASNWYDWCCNNWDTKWNACHVEWYGDEYVDFDTAWSCPEGIYKQLAKMFPDVRIEVQFADEDIGSNCGTILCENGNCEIEYIDTVEFACGVWEYDIDEYTSYEE